MKILLISAIFLLAVLSQEGNAEEACPSKATMMKVMQTCMSPGGGARRRRGVPPGFKVTPCMSKCVMVGLEAFDESGKLNKAKSMEVLDACGKEHSAMLSQFENAKKCLNEHESTLNANDENCETFEEFTKCTFPSK